MYNCLINHFYPLNTFDVVLCKYIYFLRSFYFLKTNLLLITTDWESFDVKHHFINTFLCVTKFATIKLVVTTHATNISNSTLISMRAMWHYFYIGLACQNCFAHLVLVLLALSMALLFREGSDKDWTQYTAFWLTDFLE